MNALDLDRRNLLFGLGGRGSAGSCAQAKPCHRLPSHWGMSSASTKANS